MLTDTQKNTLKTELLKMKEQASERKEDTYPKASMKETSGELSMYDNHPGDLGTVLYEREKDLTLHEHAESELAKVDIALKAMEENTYGKCSECNQDIPYERLLIVPYTTMCVEHAELMEQSVQEDTAINEMENPFENTRDPEAFDYENSFQEVAEFGTSDSPSDFNNSEKPTYFNDGDPSLIDKIVADSVTDNTED